MYGEQYTNPFYKEKLRENFRQFSAFGDVFYPLKSNGADVLLRELQPMLRGGDGFSIASQEHFEKLKRISFPTSQINLIDVQAENDFVEFLYNNGVRNFTFDNMQSAVFIS